MRKTNSALVWEEGAVKYSLLLQHKLDVLPSGIAMAQVIVKMYCQFHPLQNLSQDNTLIGLRGKKVK